MPHWDYINSIRREGEFFQMASLNGRLTKISLEFQKTVNYFKKHILAGNSLSKAIIEETNLKNGSFYAFLPENTNVKKLYEFESGGVILSSDENSPDKPLVSFVSDFLSRKNETMLLIEDVLLDASSSRLKIPGLKTLLYNNEVFYLGTNQSGIQETGVGLARGGIWHQLAVVSTLKEPPESLNEKKFKEIATNAEIIITNAYDEEAYLFWERSK